MRSSNTSNTSADNTWKKGGDRHDDKSTVGIHWLDATLNLDSPYMVLLIMGINLFEGEEETRKGYRQQGWGRYWSRLTTRYGNVYFDGSGRYPARLSMNGTACETYLTTYGAQRFMDLVIAVEQHARHIHRIDPYIDDRSGLITLRKVQRHFATGAYRTYLRQFRDTGNPTAPDSPRTIYLGSEKSDMFLRIYDKRARHRVGWTDLPVNAPEEPWTRFEIQARRSKAEAITSHIAQHKELGTTIAGVLSNCLTLTRPTKDLNRSRWPDDPKWVKFLKAASKIKLTRPDSTGELAPLDERMKRARKAASAYVRQYGMRALWQELLAGDAELQPRHLKDIDPEKRCRRSA